MTNTTRFPGVPFTLAGRSLLVPGLSLKQMKENKPTLLKFVELDKQQRAGTLVDPFEMNDAMASLIQLAISRNHADITMEMIEEEVDTNSMQSLMEAIMGGSGLKVVPMLPAGSGGESGNA